MKAGLHSSTEKNIQKMQITWEVEAIDKIMNKTSTVVEFSKMEVWQI